ncbi:RNA-binding protein [Thermocladium modestius]|uniref:RNA-binding protein n=1 Tax=Thermocladium modestius TaxID=62609 RepID=A0A830GTU7_9CREN|nr:THUMP domain-containing protein [Thermocladium modestius]GGP20455.1 RNA-binding protein [Thermocladium modestius]
MFNLVVSTGRRTEGYCMSELKKIGDLLGVSVKVQFTGFDGLLTALSSIDPFNYVRGIKSLINSNKYLPKFTLKVVPVQVVVDTDVDKIKQAALELASRNIGENETFKIEIRKRGVDLRRAQIIDAIAPQVGRKVNLDSPSKIINIEVFPSETGISVLTDDDVFSLLKSGFEWQPDNY